MRRNVSQLFDLSGRVALVTGGSRGLGKEISEGLAEAGASLMLLARREQWLDPTREDMRKRAFRCETMVCDVTDPAAVQAAVDRTLELYGKLDILVNNAGVTWGAPAESMPLEKWRMVLDVNLTGAFLFSQLAGRHMLERGYGRIINIASVAGLRGIIEEHYSVPGYVASKGGLMALTRELAAKWGRRGIRVNCIAPGFFLSRMSEKILQQVQGQVEERTPLGRIGRPGEVKGVAVFLAADASNYITGQTIIVDGGGTIV